ncbi:MAG TPA: hypothetical protein VGA87_07890 [Pyrinomonadaceae bacterium]|jgi:hypothetical protein
MNDLPRHTLSRIIAEHGREICGAPKRVEALLRDLCGGNRREINIIIGALEERVASDLMAAGNSVPRDLLLSRLAARLRDDLAYTPEAARWGVETWAVALGILSEAELRERARAEPAEDRRADATPPVQKPEPPAATPTGINQQASQTQRSTAPAPPPRTSQATKPSAPPPIVRTPASTPPQKRPANINVAPPRQPQQNVSRSHPPQPTPRRGLTLRGCFIAVVLFVLLILAAVFLVPAVIMVLQEEQAKPSINEPGIR